MKNKDKIVDLIKENPCWILASQVSKTLVTEMDKATVYRNIKKLTIEWLIIEDFNESWEKILKKRDNHHHHFICNSCCKKIGIGCQFQDKIKSLWKEKGFIATSHSFVITWFCLDCKK